MHVILVLLSLATLELTSGSVIPEHPLDDPWLSYKLTFNKVYSEADEPRRKEIWEENVGFIQQHNMEAENGLHSYTLGENQFTDLTNEEYRRMLFTYTPKNVTFPSNFLSSDFRDLPEEVDWRKEGYVTPIRNQGQCGSCWAFTAIASLEGQHFKKTGKLVALSAQEVVDCSWKQGNDGCEGGLPDNAFEYIKVNHGVDTQSSYPYVAKDEKCKFKRANVGATVTGYSDVTPRKDEDALKIAVAKVGPIAAALDASKPTFQMYKSGIYDDKQCSSTSINHGSTVIGYGRLNGKDYWLCKNMWGTTWGMEGYFLIARNAENLCGLANVPSYPNV